MEVAESTKEISEKPTTSKRKSIFQRLRRRFTLVFRRRNVRKRTKSESEVVEKQDNSPNSEEKAKLRLSLTIDQPQDITSDLDEVDDTSKSVEPNFRPPAKVALFVNDFTSELKQSLKLRSRKIEEGETSPSEAIKQIEVMRALSTLSEDFKPDVKIEIESKTFEEKLALFESQISGGSESHHDTLKRNKSDHGDSDECQVKEERRNDELEEKDKVTLEKDKENMIDSEENKLETAEDSGSSNKSEEKRDTCCEKVEIINNKMNNVFTIEDVTSSEDTKANQAMEPSSDKEVSEEIKCSIDVIKSDQNENTSEEEGTISKLIKENYVLDISDNLGKKKNIKDIQTITNGNICLQDKLSEVRVDEAETVKDNSEELVESISSIKCQPRKDEHLSELFTTASTATDMQ